MKTFTFPALITISGWIEIKANTMEEAKKIAEEKNEDGIEMFDLEDSNTNSEVIVSEGEEWK